MPWVSFASYERVHFKGIWLLNGTRAMLGLEDMDDEDDDPSKRFDGIDRNPGIVTCEVSIFYRTGSLAHNSPDLFFQPYGKSQLLIYQRRAYPVIDQILSQMQQQSRTSHIPVITLLMEGTADVTGVASTTFSL